MVIQAIPFPLVLFCLCLFSLKRRRENAEQNLSPSIITTFLSWISARGNGRFRSTSPSSELNSLI